MGYGRRGGGGKRRGAPSRRPPPPPPSSTPANFVPEAGPGCVISHGLAAPWALGSERIDARDYDDDVVFPDLAVNPDDGVLSVVNATRTSRVFYVTVYDHPVLDARGAPFPPGAAVDETGASRRCVTFILRLPPRSILHAATLAEPTSEIDSDVQDWSEHPNPEDEHPLLLSFPLGGPGAPWLCTQGEGGALTHFFGGNQHAIDFRCDVGTDVLAVADGEVVEVSHGHTLTGIATSNLFKWNSVMLKLDADATDASHERGASGEDAAEEDAASSSSSVRGGDLFVEYVHIRAGSARVSVGDRVVRGQKICESGDVGFSPEPHLHFTAFRSRDAAAHTCRARFKVEGGAEGEGGAFVPVAGKRYDARGEAKERGGG